MPAAPSDRRILVIAFAMVAAAGVLIAAALFFATGGGKGDPKQTGPLYLGLASDLRSAINKGSPLYFANPFGGNGFWLDRQAGRFVALDLVLPNTHDCEVRWKGRVDSYVDCHGDKVGIDDLDRFAVRLAPSGNSGQSVYVDLRKRIPAPSTVTTVPTSVTAPTG
ncbi:MAG TPA: hypothetical protein VFC99_03055 [Acidimicrobiia bacterium]|nr:hypothetical protein [Acidimicrobiia bacterium]